MRFEEGRLHAADTEIENDYKIRAWTNRVLWAGATLCVVALFWSAVLDPTIRLLHALQSLIYVAVVVFARRSIAWAFGAGCFKSGFWNLANLFVTGFVRDGLQDLALLLQTGQMATLDLMIPVVAFTGNCLVFVACLVAFLCSPRQRRSWFQFVLGGFVAIAFFFLIICITAPQFIPVLKHLFHL